jgi:hypothetical protein
MYTCSEFGLLSESKMYSCFPVAMENQQNRNIPTVLSHLSSARSFTLNTLRAGPTDSRDILQRNVNNDGCAGCRIGH